MNIKEVIRAGRVKRWHCRDFLVEQNNAEHSWGVAMYILDKFPNVRREVIIEALGHDLGEKGSAGDLQAPFKQKYPREAAANTRLEVEHRKSIGVPPQELSEAEIAILKWADLAEAIAFYERVDPLYAEISAAERTSDKIELERRWDIARRFYESENS